MLKYYVSHAGTWHQQIVFLWELIFCLIDFIQTGNTYACMSESTHVYVCAHHQVWFTYCEACIHNYFFALILFVGHQKPSLKYLNRHVRSSVGFKWYDLGIELFDVADVEVLDQIEVEYPSDLNKCCTKMFQLWLRTQPRASWNQLIGALRQVELGVLAAKIEEMLLHLEPTG